MQSAARTMSKGAATPEGLSCARTCSSSPQLTGTQSGLVALGCLVIHCITLLRVAASTDSLASVQTTHRAPLKDATSEGSAAIPQPSSSTVLSVHCHSSYLDKDRPNHGEWESNTGAGWQRKSASTTAPSQHTIEVECPSTLLASRSTCEGGPNYLSGALRSCRQLCCRAALIPASGSCTVRSGARKRPSSAQTLRGSSAAQQSGH